MKKIIFSLVALVAAMSMNAQIMKVYKDGAVVASYTAAQMDSVVYEEEQQPVQKFIYMSVENGDFSLSTDQKTLTATKDGVTLTATITTSGDYVFGLDRRGEGYQIVDSRGREAEDLVSVQVAVSGAISYDRIFVLGKDLVDTGTTGPWTYIWNNEQGGFKLEGASGWGYNLFNRVDITCWM